MKKEIFNHIRFDDQLEGFFIPAVLPSVEEKVTCPLLGAGAARTVEAEDKKGFLSEGKEPLVVFSPVKEKPPSPGRFIPLKGGDQPHGRDFSRREGRDIPKMTGRLLHIPQAPLLRVQFEEKGNSTGDDEGTARGRTGFRSGHLPVGSRQSPPGSPEEPFIFLHAQGGSPERVRFKRPPVDFGAERRSRQGQPGGQPVGAAPAGQPVGSEEVERVGVDRQRIP
ncbi:hypothetical protein SDC9_55700 [bioreactor metagenome]|uniref:Uncharacterized protein n=1 Tax=bioreactor metagenome TaxID=1076179 RepID=A0A644X510_9ZZZZ